MCFIILASWNLLHLGYEFQKDIFEDDISKAPMIILSMHTEILEQLNKNLETKNYINNLNVIQDSIIAQTLIDSYELDGNEDILRSYVLPTAVQITFKGEYFQFEQKEELEKILLEHKPEVIFYYDDIEWELVQGKIELLTKVYYILFGGFIAFMLFFASFFRYHFEIKSNVFWKIYYSSGGHYKKRRKQYFVNTLLVCFVPMILTLTIYFVLRYFQMLSFEIDYKYFGIELLTVLFSSLIAALALGKNLK